MWFPSRSETEMCKYSRRLEAGNFELRQGSHRLEKYLKMKGRLKKSLKTKFSLKNAWKLSINLEKYLIFTFSCVPDSSKQS